MAGFFQFLGQRKKKQTHEVDEWNFLHSRLCLFVSAPTAALRLPVSLKFGGALPQGTQLYNLLFSAQCDISCYRGKFESCWPLDTPPSKSSAWCSTLCRIGLPSSAPALHLTHAFPPSLHQLLQVLQSPSANAPSFLQPPKFPFLLSSHFSLAALRCSLWPNRRAGYSPP